MTRVTRERFHTLLIFLRTTMLPSSSITARKRALSDGDDHHRKKPRNMGVKKDHCDSRDVPMNIDVGSDGAVSQAQNRSAS